MATFLTRTDVGHTNKWYRREQSTLSASRDHAGDGTYLVMLAWCAYEAPRMVFAKSLIEMNVGFCRMLLEPPIEPHKRAKEPSRPRAQHSKEARIQYMCSVAILAI